MVNKNGVPIDPPKVWCDMAGGGSGAYVHSCPSDMIHIDNVPYEGHMVGIYVPTCGVIRCAFYRKEKGEVISDSQKIDHIRFSQ